METQQIILLIINIIGGIAVIGSYIFGIKAQPGGANALWGGVPPNIRPVYGVSVNPVLFGASYYFPSEDFNIPIGVFKGILSQDDDNMAKASLSAIRVTVE